MIKKIIIKYLNKKASDQFKKNCTLLGEAQILHGSNIRLMHGSTSKDITIDCDFRSFGAKFVSQNNGKINIGKRVKLGNNVLIGSVSSIVIDDGASLADNITIMDNNNHPVHPDDRKYMYSQPWDSELRRWKYSDNKPIYIGKHTWIGSNVRINKGVSIGENSIVAANSVVTKDVPPNCIAAGNPAKIVKENIDKLPRIFPGKFGVEL